MKLKIMPKDDFESVVSYNNCITCHGQERIVRYPFPQLDKVYFHVIYKIRILIIFEKVKLRSVNYFYLLTLDV